jgi:hypothetical protein
MEFGINLNFALKRWPEPERWGDSGGGDPLKRLRGRSAGIGFRCVLESVSGECDEFVAVMPENQRSLGGTCTCQPGSFA